MADTKGLQAQDIMKTVGESDSEKSMIGFQRVPGDWSTYRYTIYVQVGNDLYVLTDYSKNSYSLETLGEDDTMLLWRTQLKAKGVVAIQKALVALSYAERHAAQNANKPVISRML